MYAAQLSIGELLGIHRLYLPVSGDRGRLDDLVPFAELLAPELSLKQLLGALDPCRDLLLRDRCRQHVGEAVDVCRFERDQHPVEAAEVCDAELERLGVCFRPVPRHRSWEVDRVKLPRPRGRGLKAKVGRRLSLGHCTRLSLSMFVAAWRTRTST